MRDIDWITEHIQNRFPFFGVNKQQEMVRLVFEIMKKTKTLPEDILHQIPASEKNFSRIKTILLQKRFPLLTQKHILIDESFPQLNIDSENQKDLTDVKEKFYPQRIHIEKKAFKNDLVSRVIQKFPKAAVHEIDSYKTIKQQKTFDVKAYNRRTQDLFLIEEEYDFFKKCPCSMGVVGCGYHNINLGIGCPFECSYCFLQSYTNSFGIVLPVNIHRFLKEFENYPQNIRLGSGELTDSLVFDDITHFSSDLVDFFRKRNNTIFEFKTKSVIVEPLLSIKPCSNIVVAWSLNPQTFIDKEEHGTSSLQERLNAAQKCAQYGYRVAFHFDPIVMFEGWQQAYSEVIDQIYQKIPKDAIAWISLGTLRMTQKQKKIIENRFYDNSILQEELLMGEDGKLRYHPTERVFVYNFMYDKIIGQKSKDSYIYLCMETQDVWREWKKQSK